MVNVGVVQNPSLDMNKAKEIFREYQNKVCEQTDRLFAGWILFQWFIAVLVSSYLFPIDKMETLQYKHFVICCSVAGFFSILGITASFKFSGRILTRHILTIAQTCLCITIMYFADKSPAIYFQLFVSFAILSYYQDAKTFVTLYVLLGAHHIALNHFMMGNSLGVFSDIPQLLEYGGWIALATVFFVIRSIQSNAAIKLMVQERMELEDVHNDIKLQAEKRAQELQNSEKALQKSNWVKTGLAELNDKMRGEQEIPVMAKNILSYLVPYLNSQIAALYLKDRDNIFKVIGTYAGKNQLTEKFKMGEGIAGQAAQEKKRIVLDDIEDNIQLDGSLGTVRLANILYLPLLHDNDVKGIFVLGSTQKFTVQQSEFIQEASENVAIYFNTALSRLEMRKLLEKTEQQRRELQKQNSEIIKQQTILDEKNKQLEESNKHKSVFLANMSHELRTPLNAIIGYSELLLEDAEDMGQDDFVDDLSKIKFAGKHLLSLINGILDLSKIEAGKMDLHLEKFSVHEMLSEILVTAEPLAHKNGNNLKVEHDDDLGDMRADLVKIRQILLNLLSNAAKFTEKGTVTVKVKRDVFNKMIVFNIVDTGIGLNPQQTDKLFEPFSQADSSTTRKYGGTGLGLTISKKFCEMMGGGITVDSEEGKGSEFTVYIPIEVAKKEENDKEESHKKRPDAPPIRLSTKDGSPATILVIDDDLAIHDLMQRFADRENYHLEIAINGTEGLKIAKEVHPQVIFLDVMMPNIDGWEVLKTLKSDPNMATIPVIMISMVDDKSMGFELGASEYITKPLDLEHLSNVLKKYHSNGETASILVVEDDDNMQNMVSRMLEKDGYKVTIAGNGQLALDQLAREVPNLILLDLLMPQMDGFEFLVKLRTSSEWNNIPVIVVSAKQITNEDRIKLSGNVQKIIEKGSFNSDDLMDKISNLVSSCTRHNF